MKTPLFTGRTQNRDTAIPCVNVAPPPPSVISQVTLVAMCAEIKLFRFCDVRFLVSTVCRRWQTVDWDSGLIDGLPRKARLKGVGCRSSAVFGMVTKYTLDEPLFESR